MSELNIKITAPELAAALEHLAAALGARPQPAPRPPQYTAPPAAPPAPATWTPAVPTRPSIPAAPVHPTAAPTAPPAEPPAPAAQPMQAPVAPPPQYSLDQLQLAGGALVEAGKIKELQDLLQRYGIQRLPDLPKEQYGAYATDLRALGARI